MAIMVIFSNKQTEVPDGEKIYHMTVYKNFVNFLHDQNMTFLVTI